MHKFFIIGLFFGVVIGALGAGSFLLSSDAPPKAELSNELPETYDSLVSAMSQAGNFVEGHKWYGTEKEQAEAYRHILRILMNSVQESLSDKDFPYFYEINPFSKSGMDNADQRYLSVLINGAGVYRIWGHKGTQVDLSFSVYEEDALSKTLAALNADDMEIAPDGSFELILGGPKVKGNWMPLQKGVKRVLVRQIHSDWATELPGDIHIDRIDKARPAYPNLSSADMAEKLRGVTDTFATNVQRWPEYSRTRFDALLPVNTLTKPRDVSATGGLAGRVMVGGHFYLQDDEALLIKSYPTEAKYQAIQLGHHWWESMDYAHRQSSLTADQAVLSSDGAYYFILTKNDPGYSNWLDTEGFMRGVLLMRYDGLPGNTMAENLIPSARLVKFNDLATFLPPDETMLSPEQRQDILAQRRAHVQKRFNF